MDIRKQHRPHGSAGVEADRTDWFVEARFGMFVHWGLYAIPARGEWVRTQEKMSDADYRIYFEEFSPIRYSPKQWAEQARRAGMRYAVLTAKHHDGFCLFASDHSDFTALHAPARRDLLLEYVDAFREAGIKVGFYYSLLDWQHPDYPVDKHHPLRDDATARAGQRDVTRYVTYLHAQVRELMSNYGRIDLLWFDFSYDKLSGEAWRAMELIDMIRGLQPHIMLNNRLVAGHEAHGGGVGLGDFASPEQVIPPACVRDGAGRPVVWESCLTLNGSWGYKRDDHEWKSAAQVVRMLVECVSKSGNLLLNVGPTALGEIPPGSAEILAAVARWMDRNGDSVHGSEGVDLPKPEWGRYTRRGHVVYAHVFERPAGSIVVPGLAGRVRRARLLADGSEIDTKRPWNVPVETVDLHLSLPGSGLPDAIDTVIALELAPGDPLAG